MKTCKGCQESLPASSFYQRKIGIPYTLCKKCYLADKKKRDLARQGKALASKTCTACWVEKEIEAFHKNRSGAGGYAAICKDCAYLMNMATKYKISNIKELIADRDGLCDICKKPFEKRPHVDHDHACCPTDYTCGECFRGLLCNHCNYGLGHFRDSPQFLLAAVEYLRRFNDKS